MSKKPKLVVFEGVDGVGKSTVYQAFRESTDYAPLCIDRFLASNFAYDVFWRRKHHVKDYKGLEKSLMENMDCVLVYLTCESSVLKGRLINGHADLNSLAISRINEVDGLFFLYFSWSSFRKIIIDTANQPIEVTVDIIRDFVSSYSEEERGYMSDAWKADIAKTRLGVKLGISLDGLEILSGLPRL